MVEAVEHALAFRLIHTHFDADHYMLWRTVTERLPDVIRHLRPVVDADRG